MNLWVYGFIEFLIIHQYLTYISKCQWKGCFECLLINMVFNGFIKSVTISKTSTGKYYISILVDEKTEELPKNDNKIGIDLGIKDLVITSDGIKYSNPKTLIGG